MFDDPRWATITTTTREIGITVIALTNGVSLAIEEISATVAAIAIMRDLDLPRHPEREVVHDVCGREYTPRGSESRTLSTVGAFRVHGQCDIAVTLPNRGRDLLESCRSRGHDPRHKYYAGITRERELEHDARIYDVDLQSGGISDRLRPAP